MSQSKYYDYSKEFTITSDNRTIKIRVENLPESEIPKFSSWVGKEAAKHHPVFLAIEMDEKQLIEFYYRRMIRASQSKGAFKVVNTENNEYVACYGYEDFFIEDSNKSFFKETGNKSYDLYEEHTREHVLSKLPKPSKPGELYYVGMGFVKYEYRKFKIADLVLRDSVENNPNLLKANLFFSPLNRGTEKIVESFGAIKIHDNFLYSNASTILGIESKYENVEKFAKSLGFNPGFFKGCGYYFLPRLPNPSL